MIKSLLPNDSLLGLKQPCCKLAEFNDTTASRKVQPFPESSRLLSTEIVAAWPGRLTAWLNAREITVFSNRFNGGITNIQPSVIFSRLNNSAIPFLANVWGKHPILISRLAANRETPPNHDQCVNTIENSFSIALKYH